MSGDGALTPVSVQVALKVGGTYYQIAELINGTTINGDVIPGGYWDYWVTPLASSALVARYENTPPSNGALLLWALAEQS